MSSQLKHNCRVTGTELCSRTVAEVSPPRCAHSWLQPHTCDHNGRKYCTGCECQGGAFVLADGHVRGLDSFGREPIYDHRAYRDTNGVDEPLPGYFRLSKSPAPRAEKKQVVRYVPRAVKKRAGSGYRPAMLLSDKERAKLLSVPHTLPWQGKAWVTPTFTVIPNVVLDNSQRACTKPFTNFCPDCFTRSKTTRHTEQYFSQSGEQVGKRVFVRTEMRYGLYVPQIHACGERAEA